MEEVMATAGIHRLIDISSMTILFGQHVAVAYANGPPTARATLTISHRYMRIL